MEFIILNGEIIKRSEAKIDVEDRGYQFGDGVYEVIRVYNGKIFTVQDHLRRLEKSLADIEISLPLTSGQLRKRLEELVLINKLENGMIYLQVTRGVAPRNHAFPTEIIAPTFVAYVNEIERPTDTIRSGVKTIITEDIRWLRCDIKSLNLLGNVLARQKAVQEGCNEAILHRGQEVTEGSASNIFIVKNGVVITHESNHFILKGITKEVVLQVCAKQNIPVEERTFTLEELAEADEIFLTSTTSEVTPIIEMNGKKAAAGVPGPVTRKLQAWYEQEIENQCGTLAKKLLF